MTVPAEDQPKDSDVDKALYAATFTYPISVILRCLFALKSYQVLPAAGGYLDQDEALMRDLDTMNGLYEMARKYTKQGNATDKLLENDDDLRFVFG